MSSIPKDLTKIKAFIFDVDGVLSRSTTFLDEEGIPVRTGNVKDGYAIQFATKRNYIVGIITGGYNPRMEKRAKVLGIQSYFQRSKNKMEDLQKILQSYNLQPEEVVYVGDDIPDLEVMRYVGLSVAPSDAVPEVLAVADYISSIRGGEGVARELIEQTLKSQGVWAKEGEGLLW